MKTNLTFDDVQIVPRYSELKSRQDVNLNTKFTKKTTLHRTPIVAAPMDTICEYKMASKLLDQGSVGVLHRFRSIEKQAMDMKRLWNQWDSGAEFAQNLAEDCCEVPRDMSGWIEIDWKASWDNLDYDYTEGSGGHIFSQNW